MSPDSVEVCLCRKGLHAMTPDNITSEGRCKACRKASDLVKQDKRKQLRHQDNPSPFLEEPTTLSDAQREAHRTRIKTQFEAYQKKSEKEKEAIEQELRAREIAARERSRAREIDEFLDTCPPDCTMTLREIMAVEVQLGPKILQEQHNASD